MRQAHRDLVLRQHARRLTLPGDQGDSLFVEGDEGVMVNTSMRPGRRGIANLRAILSGRRFERNQDIGYSGGPNALAIVSFFGRRSIARRTGSRVSAAARRNEEAA